MKENARSVALTALNRCFGSGAWAGQVLDAYQRQIEPRDAALASRLTLGVLQNYCLLDYYLDRFLHKSAKMDLPVRNILRLGAYQIILNDRIPVSAAVNESVELCRKSGFASACGLVNAVLRKLAADRPEPPEDLSVRYSHPAWFVDRMIEEHGAKFTAELLKANNTEPPVETHPAFAEGEYYVQDGAAYQSVLMADPKPGMKVLDCCAAPGGKSFSAAVLMKNKGSIFSCDIHSKKLSLISEGAKRLGIDIITTCCRDAREFVPELENSFDLVIADVPCSGFGVIRKKPEIRFKSADEISTLPRIQKAIAENVSRFVRPGGVLLYSTCTIFSEENEDIAHALSGFTVEKEKTFYPQLDGTDGFYACVLRKQI